MQSFIASYFNSNDLETDVLSGTFVKLLSLSYPLLAPISSKVPMTGPVRYSHVAHFVGLSLLRDPNIAQRKPNKSASTGNLGATDGYAQLVQWIGFFGFLVQCAPIAANMRTH